MASYLGKSCNTFVQFSPLLIGHPAGREVFFGVLSRFYTYACGARPAPAADFSRAFEGACFFVFGWRERRGATLDARARPVQRSGVGPQDSKEPGSCGVARRARPVGDRGAPRAPKRAALSVSRGGRGMTSRPYHAAAGMRKPIASCEPAIAYAPTGTGHPAGGRFAPRE